jgi:methylmalonyl-CoA/ethylmalonyl-CoA epimerase
MKLNHIGVATKNVEVTTKLLEDMGYHAGDILHDDNQKVDVRFMYSDEAPTIELLFNGGTEPSPIDKIVKKNGTSVYHLCYETSDIDAAVRQFREQRYLPIGIKKPSLIDGKDVVFLYHTDNVMIELIECVEDFV